MSRDGIVVLTKDGERVEVLEGNAYRIAKFEAAGWVRVNEGHKPGAMVELLASEDAPAAPIKPVAEKAFDADRFATRKPKV